MSEILPCHVCSGTGITLSIACPGFKISELPCEMCDSTGSLTPERQAAIQRGAAVRDDRLARNMTLREEAKRLDINAVKLSKRERGLEEAS